MVQKRILLLLGAVDKNQPILLMLNDAVARIKQMQTKELTFEVLCFFATSEQRQLANETLSPLSASGVVCHFPEEETNEIVPSYFGLTCEPQYRLYKWLSINESRFDVLLSETYGGLEYYVLMAKKVGLRFQSQLFLKILNGNTNQRFEAKALPQIQFSNLSYFFMERQCYEQSDFVLSDTNASFEQLELDGYDIPVSKRKLFSGLRWFEASVETRVIDKSQAQSGVNEIVFTGDIKDSKSFFYFVDAIKRLEKLLDDKRLVNLKVVFLVAKEKKRTDIKYINSLFKVSQFHIQIKLIFQPSDIPKFLDGLSHPLLFISSPYDCNLFRHYDAISNQVKFLTIADDAVKELLGKTNQKFGVELHPYHIAQSLLAQVNDTQTDKVLDFNSQREESLVAWLKSNHEFIKEELTESAPLVSICVAHFNRSIELKQSLLSIERLTYKNFEVIVCDDGSTDPAALEYLQCIEAQDWPFSIKVYSQPNLYLGASRNTAASYANGKYILFMDDDNLAKPNELDVFIKAAQRTQAHIVTCFSDVFTHLPADEIEPLESQKALYIGGDIASGFIRNPFGDSNCLVLKSAFDKIGGFTEDYKIGRDDQEFFARAVLSGQKLVIVPESLYYYRVSSVRMRSNQFGVYSSLHRAVNPYLNINQGTPEFKNLLNYSHALIGQYQGLSGVGWKAYLLNSKYRDLLLRALKIFKWIKPMFNKLFKN
jgi:glycosyltransferase involved in cell wall biosynthesis